MEPWFRKALFATAVANVGGALIFAPPVRFARELFGLPEAGHALYLWVISTWILAFGVGYLWLALTQRREWGFVAIAAAGKLAFAFLLAAHWLAGSLPFVAVLAGLWDLVLGVLFVIWLLRHRGDAAA
jgi:hypothetical protein